MHITNPILHLCAFASTASAFYPYVPDYRCIQDGKCADAAKRGMSSELVEAIQEKGAFEVEIKQRKPQDVCSITYLSARISLANRSVEW